MNTPAHLIFGLAAFGKADAPKITAAALIGAMIPDLSLYFLAGWELIIAQTDPEVVFGEMYFSDDWQRVFRVDNSLVLWGIGLGLAIALRSRAAIALCGAAMLHIILDLPLHVHDGRAHFWPLTNWVFQSPFSYWNRNHHAGIISPIETGACVLLAGYAFVTFKNLWIRILVLILMAMQARVFYAWMFEFPQGG